MSKQIFGQYCILLELFLFIFGFHLTFTSKEEYIKPAVTYLRRFCISHWTHVYAILVLSLLVLMKMLLTGRSLGAIGCMIHHTMYNTSIDVYPSLPGDLESIVLLMASILLAVIVTAKLDFWLWHATDYTGKLPGGLYIIILKTCFACMHF